MARKWGMEASQRLTLCVFVGQESAEIPKTGLMGSPASSCSGWLGDGFVHQQNGNIIPHRIDAMALATFQALAILPNCERLLAHRADQNVQKVLWDHACYFTP